MSILKVNLSQSNSNLPNDSSKNDQTYKFEKKWLDYNIYIPFEKNHSDWRRAWLVTEKLLLKFKEEVEADGNQFVLAILNDSLHFYPDYRIQTNIEFPEEFDPRYPSQRLIEFAKANNIRFLDFNRYFKQYIAQHHLTPPYFEFTCNGHWSNLGHQVAANYIAQELLK